LKSKVLTGLLIGGLVLFGACGGRSGPEPPPELPSLSQDPTPAPSGPLVVVNDLNQACLRVLVAKNVSDLRRIKLRLKQGEHFVTLVKKYSTAGPIERGGLLGCFDLARLDPGLARTVSRLKIGQVGGPILTQFGPTLVQRTTHYHYQLARRLAERREDDRAIKEYRLDLALNPDRAASWRGLGMLYLKQGRRDLARRHLARAVALDPKNREAAVTLARLRASFAAPQTGGRFLVTVRDGVSVMSAPAPPAQVVFRLPRHAPVRVLLTRGGHYYVSNWRGKKGWALAAGFAPGPYVMITDSAAKLRRRPNPRARVAFVCVASSVLQVVGRRGRWLKLKLDPKRSGWILQDQVFGAGPHLARLVGRRQPK
jgi:SH3-like domain-containing protein